MHVLYQERAEAVAFSTVVFNVNNGVLPKEQFVQTDTNTSSFQTGTQLELSSAAYSNISNNKLSGFPFSPDRPLKE